jgi:hypothetical protein
MVRGTPTINVVHEAPERHVNYHKRNGPPSADHFFYYPGNEIYLKNSISLYLGKYHSLSSTRSSNLST